MKVLHIGLACAHGGAETFLTMLISEQRRIGVEAEVFFLADMGASAQYEDLCRVMFADRVSITEVLLRNKYDVLHLANHATVWPARAIRLSGYDGAIVVTSHVWCAAHSKGVREDAIIAVSKGGARMIQPHYTNTVQVVYNGVDPAVFTPPQEKKADAKPMVTWVGRSNDPVKDIGGLIAVAMSPFAKDFQFVVVDGAADGEEYGDWLPPGTIHCVRKPYSEMPDLYRETAASGGFLLSTTRMEACPMNILEAQACGCPVIAPAAGGIPEIVEHLSTGFVYDRSRGAEAVREAVDWLYHGDNYTAASKRAAEYVRENFTAERMCQRYLEVYREAIASHRKRETAKVVSVAMRAAIPLWKPLHSLRHRRAKPVEKRG